MSVSSLQIACPPRLRGLASAYYFVIVGLIGYGVGGTVVPLVSEYILHDTRLGGALAAISVLFSLVGILHISFAIKGFRIEIAALRDEPPIRLR